MSPNLEVNSLQLPIDTGLFAAGGRLPFFVTASSGMTPTNAVEAVSPLKAVTPGDVGLWPTAAAVLPKEISATARRPALRHDAKAFTRSESVQPGGI
jgi:hypothetical protein